MSSPQPVAVFLMGPTAAGKTDVAIALRQLFPFELISVDAALVYRGMDVGTAKPRPEELARAPHRLIDIREPDQPYSAADFCQDARREMAEITADGRIPLLVGGTMFYFHSLEYGLSDLPEASPGIRARLEREASIHGWPALHARLAAVDAETAGRIDTNDAQRIQRALEILEITGKPPSIVMKQGFVADALPYRLIKISLEPSDRSKLHSRIAARFETMLEQGLIEEVERLLKTRGLSPKLPSMRLVGYRQVREYLNKEISYSQMKDQAIAATRQLAKRQLTWLRSYEGVRRFDCLAPDVVTQCADYLRSELPQNGYNNEAGA